MDYELLILDCDGVLVDSEPLAHRILGERLAAIGLQYTPEELVRDFVGRPWSDNVDVIEQRLGGPIPDAFADAYHAELYAAFERELQPVPGVAEALERIDLPRCVASSGTHERIEAALRAAGFEGRFDGAIFSVSDVARGKPAPDLFLFAAERMGFAPERCVVVEDSPAGVEAGRAAGMDVLGYAGTTSAAELAAAGARTFADMAELPALVNGCAPRSAAGR